MRFLLPPDRGAVRARARAAVLADWMTAWAGSPVEVDVAPTYRDLALAIERSSADLVWTPPAVAARTRRAIRSALGVVRYGATECAAVLLVRKSDVKDDEPWAPRASGRPGPLVPRSLARARAAWVDPLSTSGFLLALTYLREAGLDPATFLGDQRFAGSYRDAILDVASGKADVTSFYRVAGSDAATLKEAVDVAGPDAAKLAIVAVTRAAPFDALVLPRSSRIDAALEARILALDASMSPPAMLLEACRADSFRRSSASAYAVLDRVIDDIVFESVA